MDKNLVKDLAIQRRRRRVRSRIAGDAQRPRLSVYRSEKHIYGQLIDDDAGVTLIAASSRGKDLRGNVGELDPTATANAVGEALAEKALAAGIDRVVFDRGGRRYTGRVKALADGARAKGLHF